MNFEKIKNNRIVVTLSIIGTVAGAVYGVLVLDDRYAHAKDLNKYVETVDESFTELNSKTDRLITMYEQQLIMRKSLLELKKAQGDITPAEMVELENLKKILDL